MDDSKLLPLLSNIEICFTCEEWNMICVLKDLFQRELKSYSINTGRTNIHLE